MNCELCKKELEAYREGRLPEGTKAQVKAHLEGCKDCAAIYHLDGLANRVMNEEKGLTSNPFLATRVMAEIEALEQARKIPAYQKALKPVLISISIAAAVFIGVITGSIYKPTHSISNVPVELSYMNDAAIESVDMFATSK